VQSIFKIKFIIVLEAKKMYFDMNKLRIAQVAPLYESVPPKLYGGTERVVSFLTEELVGQGNDVTLFASADSVTKARLVSVCDRSLRLDKNCVDQLAHHVVMLQLVLDESDHFDVIHYHIDYLHFPLSRLTRLPHITTLHGRLDIPELKSLYKIFQDMPVVSISLNQRKPLPHINWVENVYHGLPEKLFKPNFNEGKYLAFLGRISIEKRVDRAIEIAIRCGIPLKIAAKIDKPDREYFEQHIRKLLDHPLVEFVGEISENEKNEFMANAIALLFPIDWLEPFGLVMVEALACGTPVVAYNNGSVPELIDHGVTGFIVENQDDAVKAVKNIGLLDRGECRKVFEERFTSARMASEYTKVYSQVLKLESDKYEMKLL
jgi:glycosyltransferase involved in cell wall biosynthesis